MVEIQDVPLVGIGSGVLVVILIEYREWVGLIEVLQGVCGVDLVGGEIV